MGRGVNGGGWRPGIERFRVEEEESDARERESCERPLVRSGIGPWEVGIDGVEEKSAER